MDVQKAFDKVWITGLLYKLKKILPPYLFVLMKSYLSGRSFFVQCGDDVSSRGIILSGVPQGSVLGPHLYVVFTHDLPVLEGGLTATFADDTAFLYSSDCEIESAGKMQDHLHRVEAWCSRWNIRVNPEKSQHTTFTMRTKTGPRLSLCRKNIPHTNSVKYLGLHLDRTLTFKDHIIKKKKQANIMRKKLYYLLNKKSKLTLKNKLLLYKVCIKPIWTYCLPLWGMASKSNIEIIQRVQNITLRVCTGALTVVPNEQLHRELRIKTVNEEIQTAAVAHRDRMIGHTNTNAQIVIKNQLICTRFKKKKIFYDI